MYYSKNNGKIVILLLYVDDLLIIGDDKEAITKLKQKLQHEFEMTDLGEAQQYLRVEISRHSSEIFLSQKGYISKLLEKFNLQSCNPTRLPIDPKLQLSRDMETPKTDPKEYRSLVGSLIYLSHTRSDISYAASSVAQYMQSLETTHFQAAKKILRYLCGTANHGILLDSSSNDYTFHSYAEADWRRNVDTRRSISSILHRFRGSSVVWGNKMQPTVSLSSTEAEYRVLTDTTKDVIHFRRLFAELEFGEDIPTTIFSDNQSYINLVENPVMHARTKHIEIQHHFIREAVEARKVHVNYIPTTAQIADFLTKPLLYGSFVKNRRKAGALPCPSD